MLMGNIGNNHNFQLLADIASLMLKDVGFCSSPKFVTFDAISGIEHSSEEELPSDYLKGEEE